MNGKAIGSHQSANVTSVEWLTPPELIKSLGSFDLDPCSPVNRPWPTAALHYTIEDNGLLQQWLGRVWLNPPYGRLMTPWLKMISEHGNGLCLIFNRTDRNDVQDHCLAKADSMFLFRQRLHFYTVNGVRMKSNGGAPNVLFAYGENNCEAIERAGLKGSHVPLNASRYIVIGITQSWRYVVSIAFSKFDGEAPLQAIYKIVEEIAPEKTSKNQFYKEKIRQVVQLNYQRVKKGTYTKI
jgi:hypothetical protein